MYIISFLRQRAARAAVILVLLAAASVGVAAVAAANSPTVLPVEPDGGIGD